MTASPTGDQNCIQVCLVERQQLVRASLRMLIATHPRLTVVGEGASCTSVVVSSSARPDVMVLSHDFHADEAPPDVVAGSVAPRMLVLTGTTGPAILGRAVQLGACGLISKNEPVEVLHKAIAKVANGEAWFDRITMAALLAEVSKARSGQETSPKPPAVRGLTKREREVVELVAEGLRNQTMADRLFISEATVRHHLTSIFCKLGVTSRVELFLLAHRHNATGVPM